MHIRGHCRGDLTASKEKSLDGSAQVIKVKPIKPVDNFWKGNYQKRPVPWRKEQLGAFPSYKVRASPSLVIYVIHPIIK